MGWIKSMDGIKSLIQVGIKEQNRMFTSFVCINFIFVFRNGFWGVDITAWLYTWLLLFPILVILLPLSFPRYFLFIAFLVEGMWLYKMEWQSVGWMLGGFFLYHFFYYVQLYFFDLNAVLPRIKRLVEAWKSGFCMQAFCYVYAPLQKSWYVEPVIWMRFYVFFLLFGIGYAGVSLLFYDWKQYLMRRQAEKLRNPYSEKKRVI